MGVHHVVLISLKRMQVSIVCLQPFVCASIFSFDLNLAEMLCDTGPQAAVCQVNTEQNDGDVEPRRVLFDTMEPTETCSRQQIVKSWCTCWGLAQILVGVGFILFPYIRMTEHDHFAHDHLSPSNPKYLQWLLQSRSRS
jgi:hypothetical protein